MQLRKYGFHGLSYASIVLNLAKHLQKSPKEVNVVVAHLGSGASSCCIRNGESIDTSEYLPLSLALPHSPSLEYCPASGPFLLNLSPLPFSRFSVLALAFAFALASLSTPCREY